MHQAHLPGLCPTVVLFCLQQPLNLLSNLAYFPCDIFSDIISIDLECTSISPGDALTVLCADSTYMQQLS